MTSSGGKGAGRAASASGPTVAIPRALLVYDYAPLLTGFLDALARGARLSDRTDQQILEHAVELSYTDSCFPLKLLHGHVARLREADFILYPSLLRLAPKEGDENQHYACPLVQASPYIVRTALDSGARLIAPALDLSRGPEPVVRSLAANATRQMGYSRREGQRAARAGLAAQERFSRRTWPRWAGSGSPSSRPGPTPGARRAAWASCSLPAPIWRRMRAPTWASPRSSPSSGSCRSRSTSCRCPRWTRDGIPTGLTGITRAGRSRRPR